MQRELIVSALVATCALAGCGRGSDAAADSAADSAAAAAPADVATTPPGADTAGWRSLADTAAWRAYKQQALPAGWTVADGVLSKSGARDDIISKEQFGDFDLEWEWKLSRGGNAGVFYRVIEEGDKVYWTGPEYQLLDDGNAPDGGNRLTSAAAVYGLYPAPAGVVKPAGEWNTARVVARGARVEHWLNGQKVAEYELGSPDWEAKVKASKFVEWPKYGRATRGHVAIQGDHEGDLSIRNMRVRELR